MSYTATYKAWANLRDRVKYGGVRRPRSYSHVDVCDRWQTFENFYEDTGDCPEEAWSSIDRKDPDKGYNPDNCRWANPTIQSRNSRCKQSNVTKVKGVFLNRHGTYVATLSHPKLANQYLGAFSTLAEAAAARHAAEDKYWGDER